MALMKIVKIINENPRAKTFRFIPERPMPFRAGQFVMVEKEIKVNGKKKHVKRAYSISSSPCNMQFIEITVSLDPKGLFTPVLFRMKEGSVLNVTGPFGVFFLNEDLKKVTMIAGGTGITPFYSMMGCATEKMLGMDIALFYSSRHINEILFREELMEMAKKHKNLKLIFTITRGDEKELRGWQGETGRISAEMIRKYTPDFKKRHYYIVGPPPMVADLNEMLRSMGVPKKSIESEKW